MTRVRVTQGGDDTWQRGGQRGFEKRRRQVRQREDEGGHVTRGHLARCEAGEELGPQPLLMEEASIEVSINYNFPKLYMDFSFPRFSL